VWTADFSRALSDYDASRPGELTHVHQPPRSHPGAVACAWLKRSSLQSPRTYWLICAVYSAWLCMPAGYFDAGLSAVGAGATLKHLAWCGSDALILMWEVRQKRCCNTCHAAGRGLPFPR
jgi:hypothetical protein